MDVQVDLSLWWSHKSYCRFCRALVQICFEMRERVCLKYNWTPYGSKDSKDTCEFYILMMYARRNSKGKERYERISEMTDIDRLCILIQIWSKSDNKNKKVIKVLRCKECFHGRHHFENLIRLHDVIKPKLNMQNISLWLFATIVYMNNCLQMHWVWLKTELLFVFLFVF